MPLKWGKDRKQLAPRNSKDMCTMRNESILTTSLHLHCSGGTVSTTDLSWKNVLRSQTKRESKKINWCVLRIDTVPKSVRLQGRSKAQHFQSVTSWMSQNSGTKVFMAVYAFPELRIFLLPLHYRDRLLSVTPELESTCKFSLWYSHGFIYASFSVTLLVYIPMVITAKTIIGRTHLKLQRANRRIIQRTALGPNPGILNRQEMSSKPVLRIKGFISCITASVLNNLYSHLGQWIT